MRCKLAALMDAHNLQVSQAGHGKRMSQRTLAQETGLPLTSINRYFNDAVQRIDKDIVECQCHALNCGIEDFFALDPPQHSSDND